MYLPSNSSMNIFPDNTVSHFRVKLRRPLELSGEFEVALVEISYPTLWENVDNKHCRLAINTDGQSWREIGVTPGYYVDSQTFIRSLERQFADNMDLGETRIIHYDHRQRRLTFDIPGNTSIQLYDGIAHILGYPSARKLDGPRRHFPPGTVDVNHGVYNLYIYTDIVTPQLVGDTETTLLSTVSFDTYRLDDRPEVRTKVFQTPHYVPVNRPSTDTILIDIRDSSGERIPFLLGKVIIKLHFRQKRPAFV